MTTAQRAEIASALGSDFLDRLAGMVADVGGDERDTLLVGLSVSIGLTVSLALADERSPEQVMELVNDMAASIVAEVAA